MAISSEGGSRLPQWDQVHALGAWQSQRYTAPILLSACTERWIAKATRGRGMGNERQFLDRHPGRAPTIKKPRQRRYVLVVAIFCTVAESSKTAHFLNSHFYSGFRCSNVDQWPYGSASSAIACNEICP